MTMMAVGGGEDGGHYERGRVSPELHGRDPTTPVAASFSPLPRRRHGHGHLHPDFARPVLNYGPDNAWSET